MERLDVSTAELEALLEQARREPLAEDGYRKLKAAIDTLAYVTELLEKKETSLAALRELLCPATTEKTSKVLEQAGLEAGGKKPEHAPKRAAPGHGRNGAAAYKGARRVPVPHASLKAGDPCPGGCGGKVYPQHEPGVLVRVHGQAPIAATVYELEKLRCNLCGDVFTAAAPEDVGEKKYDETAASMIALLRYGSGFPWYRLAGLEESLGIPLPVATQCEIVVQTAILLRPLSRNWCAKRRKASWCTTTTPPCACCRWTARTFRPSAPVCSPAAWCGLCSSTGSRCSSPAPNTPARTWPTCWASGHASCHRRFRCAMRCRATCPNSHSNPCWQTATRTAGGTS
jgi:hypothetical protein